jgi:hypothetical protein
VVIEEGKSCRICLPATSYHGSWRKLGSVELQKHGLLYGYSKKLSRPTKVEGMLSKPLTIKISPRATIHKPCLVNYGKMYTAEKNAPVKDVGMLNPDSCALLLRSFEKVTRCKLDDLNEPSGPTTQLTFDGIGGAVAAGASSRRPCFVRPRLRQWQIQYNDRGLASPVLRRSLGPRTHWIYNKSRT